jgi:hypothetical protein
VSAAAHDGLLYLAKNSSLGSGGVTGASGASIAIACTVSTMSTVAANTDAIVVMICGSVVGTSGTMSASQHVLHLVSHTLVLHLALTQRISTQNHEK